MGGFHTGEMSMFICKVGKAGGLDEARRQAQANADRTGEAWVVFSDTSGNLRVERAKTGPNDVYETVYPQK